MENTEITEEIKNFLKTTEGRRVLRESTPGDSPAARSEFKKSLIDPPANVRKHLRVIGSLKTALLLYKSKE